MENSSLDYGTRAMQIEKLKGKNIYKCNILWINDVSVKLQKHKHLNVNNFTSSLSNFK